MAQHDEIEKDQYDKIHELTKKVESLTGAVDVANQINIELSKLLKRALSYEFYVIIILIAALVYGAIGEKGLYSVRQFVPMPMQSIPTDDGTTDGAVSSVIFPWYGDRKIVKA